MSTIRGPLQLLVSRQKIAVDPEAAGNGHGGKYVRVPNGWLNRIRETASTPGSQRDRMLLFCCCQSGCFDAFEKNANGCVRAATGLWHSFDGQLFRHTEWPDRPRVLSPCRRPPPPQTGWGGDWKPPRGNSVFFGHVGEGGETVVLQVPGFSRS